MLGFPNQMSSFDEEAGTFRFSGYDGVMEVRFVLEAPALEQIDGLTRSAETDYPLQPSTGGGRRSKPRPSEPYKKHRKNLIWLSIAGFLTLRGARQGPEFRSGRPAPRQPCFPLMRTRRHDKRPCPTGFESCASRF